MTASPLLRGREAFDGHRWGDAFTLLTEADGTGSLQPADLERLAAAAFLTGRDLESVDLLTRAHQALLAGGDVIGAARTSFWLFFALHSRGDRAAGSGWAARGQRLLDEAAADCVERGYLLLPPGLARVGSGDFAAAHEIFTHAARIGERFGDASLTALAQQGAGRTLLALGDRAGGLSLLDQAMVAVTAGELAPAVTGTVYCSVLEACFDVFDLARAQEWTGAFGRWCAMQPEMAPYRGQCLVRRTEIFVLRGRWAEALEEAHQACERLVRSPADRGALAAAQYQIAEIHRLRGELDAADHWYRQASGSGSAAQPGLSLLRLAQGRSDAACAAIKRALDEIHDPRVRSRMLGPAIEILISRGDMAAADGALEELEAMASALDAPFLKASARYAHGRILLGCDDARGALEAAREACALWREMDAPYHAARAIVLIASACRELGDIDGSLLELEAARATFERIGATRELENLGRVAPPSPPPAACPLTERELQVLRLVASGRTNGDIADQLDISPKTVARHLANIFTKLGVSNRSAATAYAFQHNLM